MADKHIIKISNIIKFFKEQEKLITYGENAFELGQVANMSFDEHLRILKGSVHAFIRDRLYDIEIYFNSDWSIERALCSCPRGPYRCHHMVAMALFGHYNISVSNKACSSTAHASLQSEVKQICNPTEKHNTKRKATDDEVQVLDVAAGFTYSKKVPLSNDNILICIEDIIFSDEFINNPNQKEYFENKLKINESTIADVYRTTTGQNKNEHWLNFRKNRITASNFGAVLSACRRNCFSLSLFKKLSDTYNIDNLKAIQWGREHEKEALESFEKSTNMKVVPTGLWLHECGYIGASPDGLVNENAIIEVKCPYKYREISLLEGIKNNKNYIIISDSEGNITINKNHEYFYQIQGQLAITKRQICYLIVWTPKEEIIVSIEAENYTRNIELLKEFYLNQFLPFLIGKYVYKVY